MTNYRYELLIPLVEEFASGAMKVVAEGLREVRLDVDFRRAFGFI